ncbi:MAG: orotidine-5'-phosphate decarboxylase [Phycisphaerales bacterium]
MADTTARFSDRLAAGIDRVGTPACVGLDPVIEKLPAALVGRVAESAEAVGAIERFCMGVLDAVAGIVAVVKPQSACFERYGSAGVAVLESVIRAARERGLLVILDAKRGDIGVSGEHYASAAFDGPGRADALTISGYLGPDTIPPMVRPGTGLFVLVRTSNPGSDATQGVRLADGRTVGEMMADLVSGIGREHVGVRGLSDIGAVVGATKAAEGRGLRRRMREQYLLVPGFGAQGGTVADVRELVREGARTAGELGIVVNASRSVLYPGTGGEWKAGVRDAARRLAEELRALSPG